jgi:hypothetical protein
MSRTRLNWYAVKMTALTWLIVLAIVGVIVLLAALHLVIWVFSIGIGIAFFCLISVAIYSNWAEEYEDDEEDEEDEIPLPE